MTRDYEKREKEEKKEPDEKIKFVEKKLINQLLQPAIIIGL